MLRLENLRLTTLCENTSTRPGLLGEWGLSVLIEAGDYHFLFDTGSGHATVHNADELGIDLSDLQKVVLSHGHSDHTGGLATVLSCMKKPASIIAHPEALSAKYVKDRDKEGYRYIGIPFHREYLETAGARFELSTAPTWLSEDVAASGEEPMTTGFEKIAGNLFVGGDDHYTPDPFLDDQSIYIRTDQGLVVVLGCAHRGMINVILHARSLMGMEQIHMVVGGTHLGPASSAQVEATIAALEKMEIRWLGVSHCTGSRVAGELHNRFKGRFFFNNTGTRITFPFSGVKDR